MFWFLLFEYLKTSKRSLRYGEMKEGMMGIRAKRSRRALTNKMRSSSC